MRNKLAVSLVIGFLFISALLTWRKRWSQVTDVPLSSPLIVDFTLIDVEDAPVIQLDDSQLASDENDEKCTHFTCFDVYRCDTTEHEHMQVYIYPVKRYVDSSGILISSPFTDEFWQLLEVIRSSPYYTSDPSKSCLFIPSIDMLSQSYVRLEETSQVLNSLQYWNRDGSNHLIFNMIPGSFPDYNRRLDMSTGKSMIAGGGFDSWTYRTAFDVSLPVYSPHSADPNNHLVIKEEHQRKWFLLSTQLEAMDKSSKQIISNLEERYKDEMLILSNRCLKSNENGTLSKIRCNVQRNITVNYPTILQKATFCLVARTAYLGTPLISDIIMSGCIPVFALNEYVLPFEELIDWKRVSVRIHESSLKDVFEILKSVTPSKITEMQKQTVFVWTTYFSTIKAITLTTLGIINDRLNPHAVISKEDRNLPFSFPKQQPPALVSPKSTTSVTQGFTAVILTYERKILYDVIRRVVQAPSCTKVIVVWNSQRKKPPTPENWPQLNIPLKVIQTKANKLGNRFYPYASIETDAILAIDDDIVMLNADELEFGFQVWREFPDRLVGFPSRVHRWDNSTSMWKYESEWTNDVSMVLTGAAFYHKHYNYLYSFVMPSDIRLWVDERMNCEDIAMNFLIANVTGKAPIKVTPRKKFKCPECTNGEMLSADVMRHLSERSECINRFAKVYGTMPLKTVEFRADPVLFKDNLPEKLKKYNQIGSL